MKKILVSVLFGLLCLAAVPASQAYDMTPVTVSTYPVTETATLAANISGSATIDKIVLTNSTTTATTVTMYKNCDSTTTVSAILSVVLPSVAVSGGGTVVLDYTDSVVNNPLRYSNICFRKATDAADTYVKASVHYR